jgi:hypothetical protein
MSQQEVVIDKPSTDESDIEKDETTRAFKEAFLTSKKVEKEAWNLAFGKRAP